MIEIGTVLQDRFLIEEQIGVGGMGAVYRATDQKFGSAVAIKETFYRDKDLAEAFEREARLLNGLHHPLFPHVSDHFTEGDGHFLVMEFIEGQDLSELLKRGERFPFETVMRWTLDLLDGLDYLHSQDPPVIHRDIKPNNLKLTSRGNIVLLDFGMAKETSGNTQGMRSVFGYSRRYSPLEQIEGTGTDVRSDIFSLGATVYHLLTGTPPVDVLRRASTIVAGRPDPIEPASLLNPKVPERIAALLSSALALNPDMRFASARAMWNALEHSLEGQQTVPPIVSAPSASATPVGIEAPSRELTEDSFPALAAFEAEMDEESTASASGLEFRTNEEVDGLNAAPIAYLGTQTNVEDSEPHSTEPFSPAGIEVPVAGDPENIKGEVPETDAPRATEILTRPPFGRPIPASNWRSSPILLALPVLLLVLGVIGYILFRGDKADETRVEQTPTEQAASPNATFEEAVTSEPLVESNPSEATVAVTDEPKGAQRETSDTDNSSQTQPQAERRERQNAGEGAPTPSKVRPNSTSGDQTRNRIAANDRFNRAARPRIVEDRVFEQPPVSSIESIMTGIPVNRPRGQTNWEVLEDDQIRRERRLRRMERRNRQRWPLF
jgi:serine/threonine protein kinase